jgi:hypothetical protein
MSDCAPSRVAEAVLCRAAGTTAGPALPLCPGQSLGQVCSSGLPWHSSLPGAVSGLGTLSLRVANYRSSSNLPQQQLGVSARGICQRVPAGTNLACPPVLSGVCSLIKVGPHPMAEGLPLYAGQLPIPHHQVAPMQDNPVLALSL